MSTKTQSCDHGGEQSVLLKKIADTLDCSVSDFVGPGSSDLSQTVELMHMWMTLEHEQDRLKVLALIRNIIPTTVAQQRR